MGLRTIVYTFDSPATLAVTSRLVETGSITSVILQRPMDSRARLRLLRHRLRRYGPIRVADELLFQVLYRVFLKRSDDRLRRSFVPDVDRQKERLAAKAELVEVDSLNTVSGRALLERMRPDLVVMMSREMIGRDVLAIPRLGFVGCHPGILPEYRGAYAPFWALRDGRADKVGVSIYLANGGVDTGPLIKERTVAPKFPLRHFRVEAERLLIEGAQDLIEVIGRAQNGRLTTFTKPGADSHLFTHVGLTHFLGAIVRPHQRRHQA
jgi:folate-dependent phosphoribosylglycinamide formyltransferase PurN